MALAILLRYSSSQPSENKNTLKLILIQAAFIHPLMTDEVVQFCLFASAIMMFKRLYVVEWCLS
jgi:hypothetical protein